MNRSAQILKLVRLPEIDPWQFCEIYAAHRIQPGEWGYRAMCVRFLAEVLDLAPQTVNSWGSQFEQMPAWARRQLSYLHALAHRAS